MSTRPASRHGGDAGAVICAELSQLKADEKRPPGASNRGGGAVIVVSADHGLRRRLAESLEALRWQVREAQGGADAMLRVGEPECEAMVLDSWLPDLEAGEFAEYIRLMYPAMDVICLDGAGAGGQAEGGGLGAGRSSRRNQLLHAVREAFETAASFDARGLPGGVSGGLHSVTAERRRASGARMEGNVPLRPGIPRGAADDALSKYALPELIGGSEAMRAVARLVRMVAPRSTTVLIEGETGTGKEVIARALHGLSGRAAKPFVVLNCAAIPESLLEAELFGHTRGAFTGAVQSRTGRIEAANGGTLLLDEIGEMPIGMQAKMLRFLESGELQRVGENQMLRVDVRLIAATHQPLEERSAEGRFRLDLYYRLAVFPIEVPPLRERMEDIAELAEYFLDRMGKDSPRKRLTPAALEVLCGHRWPGNVRELMHVLERAAILSGDNPEIGAADVRCRRASRD